MSNLVVNLERRFVESRLIRRPLGSYWCLHLGLPKRKPTIGFPNRSITNQPIQKQDFEFKKKDCTIYGPKTKALISCAVTVFVLAYADC